MLSKIAHLTGVATLSIGLLAGGTLLSAPADGLRPNTGLCCSIH